MDKNPKKPKAKKAFEKDERNAGGRKIVEANMNDFLKKIEKAKGPIMLDVNNNQPPVHINEKSGKRKNLLESKMQESNATKHKEKVMKASRCVDNDIPACDKAKAHLKNMNKREKMHEEEELSREWNSMTRRIAELGNENDRKKNIYDPIAYPPVLFKRKENEMSSSSSFFNYKTSERVPVVRDVSKIKEKLEMANEIHKKTIKKGAANNQNAKQKGSSKGANDDGEVKGAKETSLLGISNGESHSKKGNSEKMRKIKGKTEREIRNSIVELIIKERICQKRDFLELFKEIRAANGSIPKETLDSLEVSLLKEMDF